MILLFLGLAGQETAFSMDYDNLSTKMGMKNNGGFTT